MDEAKRARTAETPKQPCLGLKLRAPYFYPDGSGRQGCKSRRWETFAVNCPNSDG